MTLCFSSTLISLDSLSKIHSSTIFMMKLFALLDLNVIIFIMNYISMIVLLSLQCLFLIEQPKSNIILIFHLDILENIIILHSHLFFSYFLLCSPNLQELINYLILETTSKIYLLITSCNVSFSTSYHPIPFVFITIFQCFITFTTLRIKFLSFFI